MCRSPINYDREDWIPVPGEFHHAAKSISLKGTYQFTSEDYSVTFATTVCADLMAAFWPAGPSS
jgi:hypothetical protein